MLLDHGVSNAAKHVEDMKRRAHRELQASSAFGMQSLLQGDLFDTWVESAAANWDGHGALPVSLEACQCMARFLNALPLGIQHPTIGADPNGWLSVEWYRSPRRVLSISVTEHDLLHYAALMGSSRTCGTEAFFGQIPKTILDLIHRVNS